MPNLYNLKDFFEGKAELPSAPQKRTLTIDDLISMAENKVQPVQNPVQVNSAPEMNVLEYLEDLIENEEVKDFLEHQEPSVTENQYMLYQQEQNYIPGDDE